MMTPEIVGLCEQAKVECDPAKLLALVEKINILFDQQRTPAGTCTGLPASFATSIAGD